MTQSPQSITSSRPHAWFLWLDGTARPGWQNMSLDMSLHARAARTGHRCLRFYRWDPSCLSFGRHEPARKRYDRERITSRGIDTVRRPTGGRAVWHADELTYSVTAPEAVLGTLPDAYRHVHDTIAAALRTLGAPVDLAPARRGIPLDAGACFAMAAGGEVVVHGSKVVGSAQLRRDGAVLQHGSVLLNDDQALLQQVTIGPSARADVQPLSGILGRKAEWSEVAIAIADAAARWGPRWEPFADEQSLLEEADKFASQFRDPAWTWQR